VRASRQPIGLARTYCAQDSGRIIYPRVCSTTLGATEASHILACLRFPTRLHKHLYTRRKMQRSELEHTSSWGSALIDSRRLRVLWTNLRQNEIFKARGQDERCVSVQSVEVDQVRVGLHHCKLFADVPIFNTRSKIRPIQTKSCTNGKRSAKSEHKTGTHAENIFNHVQTCTPTPHPPSYHQSDNQEKNIFSMSFLWKRTLHCESGQRLPPFSRAAIQQL
jgi:hypothetical protein